MSETLEHPRATTNLSVRQITPITGAEIRGVDLSRELDKPTVAAIREALLKHKVLVFHDQDLTDAQQIRFSRYFGRVTPAHPVTNGLVDAPEIKENILTRDRDEYAPFDLDIDHPLRPNLKPRAPVGWHIDITFVANPNSLTFLRAVEMPPVGGDTMFANLEALYESLSPSLRGYLDTLQAIHVA